MCGIAGFRALRPDSKNRQTVHTMLNHIAHRGPDGLDIWDNRQGVAMGINRLAMTDVKTPTQILQSRDGHHRLAFNGEIYNFQTLKVELESKGWRGRTANDGEVLLGLYQQEGLNFLTRIDGMFAFALWDQPRERLILARDRAGIKPLFFTRFNLTWYFSSELKAIASVVPTSINSKGVELFCRYRFVPGPLTICQDIFKVEPGNLVVIDREPPLQHYAFWRPNFEQEKGTPPPLLPLLKKTVAETAVAERSIGVWLSGGLDSASILALLQCSSSQVPAFTIGYEAGGEEDEGDHAHQVTQWLHSPHIYRSISDERIAEIAASTAYYLDEPLFTSVGLSTFELAKLTRECGVCGVLTGDGSDELLMGYSYLQKVKKALIRNEDHLGEYERQIGWIPRRWQHIFKASQQHLVGENTLLYGSRDLDPMDRIRWFEFRYRLTDYHLTRVDRLAMSCGVEARLPLLRNSIVDWALRRDWRTLLVEGQQKGDLLMAVGSMLPPEILKRTKQPFTSPTGRWLRGPLLQRVKTLMHEVRYAKDLGFSTSGLQDLYKHWRAGLPGTDGVIWGVFMLFQWYHSYLKLRQKSTMRDAE